MTEETADCFLPPAIGMAFKKRQLQSLSHFVNCLNILQVLINLHFTFYMSIFHYSVTVFWIVQSNCVSGILFSIRDVIIFIICGVTHSSLPKFDNIQKGVSSMNNYKPVLFLRKQLMHRQKRLLALHYRNRQHLQELQLIFSAERRHQRRRKLAALLLLPLLLSMSNPAAAAEQQEQTAADLPVMCMPISASASPAILIPSVPQGRK